MRHRHTSPIEMCEIKLHCKMPIFVARQWIRHRTANVNELSGRYSILPNEMYTPDATVIAKQSATNKQGRAPGEIIGVLAEDFLKLVEDAQDFARESYEGALELGVAKELARINLPVSQYTEWYWKIDLRNLLHFLSLRLDSHAQYEIRVYAEEIGKLLKAWVPFTWEAFEDYILNAVTFSRPELVILRHYCSPPQLPNTELLPKLSKREVDEFLTKATHLGMDLFHVQKDLYERAES